MQPHPAHGAMRTTVLAALLIFNVAIAATSNKSASQLASTSVRIAVADPAICLVDVECGPARYCKPIAPASQRGRCAPRLAIGARCMRTGACVATAFCVPGRSRCVARAASGGSCANDDACRAGLACAGGKCRTANRALGAVCGTFTQCADGLRCQAGKCVARRAAGATCSTLQDFACAGFCVIRDMFSGRGVCVAPQPLGAVCTDENQCNRPLSEFSSVPRGDRVLCNMPRGLNVPGVCARPTQLLRRLGASCTVAKDLCDARRGLSCRWDGVTRRTVCQQREDPTADMPLGVMCTRGNRLSKCGPQSECRKERLIPGNPFAGFTESTRDVLMCRRRRTVVPVGADCATESVGCAPGSVCRVVRGLLLDAAATRSRFGAQQAAYCVRPLKQGEGCSVTNQTKFRAACANGLTCVGGKCVTTPRRPPPVPNTHAYISGSCVKLPCAPGFFCGPEKKCVRGGARAALGALCDSSGTPRPRCKAGLVCRTQGLYGAKRCRPAQGVGAYCEENSWCAGKLRCPRIVTPGREMEDRRCYDPAKVLWLGQKCDPATQRTGPRCLSAQLPEGGGFDLRALRCLPKPDGSSACQIEARPFGLCGTKMRLICTHKHFECRGGLCLPRK